MTSTPQAVETGQVREYLFPSGALFGRFRVLSKSGIEPYWIIGWETGEKTGTSQSMHTVTIKGCPVVEA